MLNKMLRNLKEKMLQSELITKAMVEGNMIENGNLINQRISM